MQIIGSRDFFLTLGILAVTAAGSWAADNPAATQPQSRPALSDTRPAPSPPQFWFGVAVENIPPNIARQLKLNQDQGLMVMAVLPGTPAEKAGLKAEDILIELDGTPLTSQEDLARAANTNLTIRLNVSQLATPIMKPSRIAFLREGDHKLVNIMPGPRPENMLVMGNNMVSFVPQQTGSAVTAGAPGDMLGRGVAGGPGPMLNANIPGGIEMRNVVFSDGTVAQVGPGYMVDMARGNSSTVTIRSIRQLVSKGDSVVLTQQTDSSGNVRNTIVMGGRSYPVDKGNVEALPVALQPLALQLVASATQPSAATHSVAAQEIMPAVARMPNETPSATTLEQRVGDLEKQNKDLRGQLSELIDLLKKSQQNK